MSSFVVIFLRGWKEDPPPPPTHTHKALILKVVIMEQNAQLFSFLVRWPTSVTLCSNVITNKSLRHYLIEKSSCNHHFQKTMICSYITFCLSIVTSTTNAVMSWGPYRGRKSLGPLYWTMYIYKQFYTSADFFPNWNFRFRILHHHAPYCDFSGNVIQYSLGRWEIIVYLEYQSVCLIVGIGSPHPLSRKRVCIPLGPKGGGGGTLSCGWGGADSDDWIEGLALCILCGLGGRVERKKPFTRAARVR